MTTLSNIKVIDRRRDKKEEPTPAVETIPVSAGDGSSWEEVKYAVACRVVQQNQPGPLQLIIMGRVLGLRSDGIPFVADYWFSADYDDCRDWETQAKKRLDTFLGCGCDTFSPCAVHKMYFEQWEKADIQRLTLAGQKPVPKVLEILHQAEMARQQRAKNISLPR
jgi:hypothetical protein